MTVKYRMFYLRDECSALSTNVLTQSIREGFLEEVTSELNFPGSVVFSQTDRGMEV